MRCSCAVEIPIPLLSKKSCGIKELLEEMLVWAERIFKVLQPQCCSSSHLATIGSNKEGLFANKFRLGGREGLLTLWKRELNHLEIQIYLKYPFFTVTKQGQKRSLASFAHHFMRAQLATLVVLGVVLLVFHSRASNLSLKIEGEGIPFLFYVLPNSGREKGENTISLKIESDLCPRQVFLRWDNMETASEA